jgi:hypothetical protein
MRRKYLFRIDLNAKLFVISASSTYTIQVNEKEYSGITLRQRRVRNGYRIYGYKLQTAKTPTYCQNLNLSIFFHFFY